MDQAIQPQYIQALKSQNNQDQDKTSFKQNKTPKCTCEIGKLKALGKNGLRGSMCDVCSERLFCAVISM